MLSFVSRIRHIHPLESLCFFIKITIYYGYISHVHDGLSDAPGKLQLVCGCQQRRRELLEFCIGV